MNKYLVTSYRWAGGEIRERQRTGDLVAGDRFEVEGHDDGPMAMFYSETGELIAAYRNFESVVLVTE